MFRVKPKLSYCKIPSQWSLCPSKVPLLQSSLPYHALASVIEYFPLTPCPQYKKNNTWRKNKALPSPGETRFSGWRGRGELEEDWEESKEYLKDGVVPRRGSEPCAPCLPQPRGRMDLMFQAPSWYSLRAWTSPRLCLICKVFGSLSRLWKLLAVIEISTRAIQKEILDQLWL